MISVALCTFNGSRYLREQLESLSKQTRLPDELVVSDDHSQDTTTEIVSNFAAKAPFPVRLHRNERNLGSTKNFEQAIRLCRGDLIALADQDDVWLPEKLERSEEAFARRPQLLGVFSDAVLADEKLNPTGHRLWDASGFDSECRGQFLAGEGSLVLLQRQVVTGATFVFRSAYKDLLLPIPSYAVHDSWLAFLLACAGDVGFIEEPHMLYRQHEENQIGARKKNLLDRVLNADVARSRKLLLTGLQFCIEAKQRLIESNLLSEGDPSVQAIEAKIQHFRLRLSLPASRWRRAAPILREIASGRYAAFSFGTLSAIQDLVGRAVRQA